MKSPTAKANPPVVRDADADPLFQRGQAERRASENTCHSNMGKDSNTAGEQDSFGMPETAGNSERLGESKKLTMSEKASKPESAYKPVSLAQAGIVAKSGSVINSQIADEKRINGEFPLLEKGGRGDLLFGHRSPAKPCMTPAAQNIGRS